MKRHMRDPFMGTGDLGLTINDEDETDPESLGQALEIITWTELDSYSSKRTALALELMQTSTIICKLAQKLPPKTLFRLRQTCKLWNEEFVLQLKKKHTPIALKLPPPNFETNSKLEPYIDKEYSQDFVASLELGQHFPFAKYAIGLLNQEQGKPHFTEFVAKFGSTVTELDLHWKLCVGISVANLRNLIFGELPALEGLRVCPPGGVGNERNGCDSTEDYTAEEAESETGTAERLNKCFPSLKLKYLSLNPGFIARNPNSMARIGGRGTFPPCGVNQAFINLIKDVLQFAPELESLTFSKGAARGNFALPVLIHLRDFVPHVSKLKKIHLDEVRSGQLEILVEMGHRRMNPLRLHSFSSAVQFDESSEWAWAGNLEQTSALLARFLQNQAGTLQKLGLEFQELGLGCCGGCHNRLQRQILLHKLGVLDTFDLTWTDSSRGIRLQLEFESTLEETFPKLRRFLFHSRGREGEVSEGICQDSGQLFHAGVTHLHLDRVNPNQVPGFATTFPKVTHLELELEDRVYYETFGKMYRMLRQSAVDQQAEELKCWTLWPNLIVVNHSPRPKIH